MTISSVVKENIKFLFLDFSLPLAVTSIFLLNMLIALEENLFIDLSTPFPFWLMYTFDTIILILYGGYIGTKFFAREYDKNTMITLIVTPAGKKGIYVGKAIAGIGVIVLISALVFLQSITFFSVCRAIPYLFLYWYGLFTIVVILSMLFSFFLAIIISCIIKKTGLSLLVVSVYTVFSFFALAFMPVENYIIDNRIAYTLLFPSLGIWYMHLSISYYAVIYPLSLLFSFISTLMLGITSYWVFMGVKL